MYSTLISKQNRHEHGIGIIMPDNASLSDLAPRPRELARDHTRSLLAVALHKHLEGDQFPARVEGLVERGGDLNGRPDLGSLDPGDQADRPLDATGDADRRLVAAQLPHPPAEIGVQARGRVERFRRAGHPSLPWTESGFEYLRRKSCSLLKRDHMRLGRACQARQQPATPDTHQEDGLMVEQGSAGGTVCGDGELANNLTDPCWLLDRAAQLLHADHHPTRAALAPLGRTMADALSALRYQANACGEPLAAIASQTITHLRLWAGTVDAETERLRIGIGEAKAPG